MSKLRDVVVVRVSEKGDREDEGSYVKSLLGGRGGARPPIAVKDAAARLAALGPDGP
jgi:hypothetical protein